MESDLGCSVDRKLLVVVVKIVGERVLVQEGGVVVGLVITVEVGREELGYSVGWSIGET